jgi:hypothetical protein
MRPLPCRAAGSGNLLADVCSSAVIDSACARKKFSGPKIAFMTIIIFPINLGTPF